MLPFTFDEFFSVFAAYNVAIWPVQIAAYVIAAMALWLIFARRPAAGRVAGGVLALFWLWDGIAYHLLFFSKINPAAYIFGAGFILQGLLFFAYGAIADRLAFRFQSGWRGVLGLAPSSTLRLFTRSLAISPGTAGHVPPCSVLHRVPPSYSPLACSCCRYVLSLFFLLRSRWSGRALVPRPRFCSVFLRTLGSLYPA